MFTTRAEIRRALSVAAAAATGSLVAVNLKTGKVLGLTVPPRLLVAASAGEAWLAMAIGGACSWRFELVEAAEAGATQQASDLEQLVVNVKTYLDAQRVTIQAGPQLPKSVWTV